MATAAAPLMTSASKHEVDASYRNLMATRALMNDSSTSCTERVQRAYQLRDAAPTVERLMTTPEPNRFQNIALHIAGCGAFLIAIGVVICVIIGLLAIFGLKLIAAVTITLIAAAIIGAVGGVLAAIAYLAFKAMLNSDPRGQALREQETARLAQVQATQAEAVAIVTGSAT